MLPFAVSDFFGRELAATFSLSLANVGLGSGNWPVRKSVIEQLVVFGKLLLASRLTSSRDSVINSGTEGSQCCGGTGISVPQLDLCDTRRETCLGYTALANGSLKSIVDIEIVRDGTTFSFRTRKGCTITDVYESRELVDTAR